MKKIFSIIALTILVWGCAKKITPVSSSNGTTSGNTTTSAAPETYPALPVQKAENTTDSATSDLAKAKSPEVMGQTTYNAKCGRCHGLKVVTNYTADRWISIMQVMATKAQLNDAEKENVLAYVKANAKK